MKKRTALSLLFPLSSLLLVSAFGPAKAEEPFPGKVNFPPEFMSLSHSQPAPAVRIPRVLDALMTFHPGWLTRSVTSHDPRGLDADDTAPAAGADGYRVLFHGKGEGRITRIWLSPGGVKGLEDYKELWIQADGQTVYKGKPADLFEGKAQWKAPLVSGYKDSGSFLSYVPFSYSREARVLFKGDPHFYQITYRQGAGSASGPGYSELAGFVSENWADNSPAPKNRITVTSDKPVTLAKGPSTVAELSLRCRPEELSRLQVRIGAQPAVPAALFFAPGGAVPAKGAFRTALNYADATEGLFITRLPIPLQAGEELSLGAMPGAGIEAAYGLASAAPRPGVRLAAQYRERNAASAEDTVPFFESTAPVQVVSIAEELSAPAADLKRRPGGELIRTDGMEYPFQSGTGGADYFNGGREFTGNFAGPFSGIASSPDGASLSSFRHHVADPVVSRADLRFSFEAGPAGVKYRTLGLAYAFDAFRPASRSAAALEGKPVVSAVDAERTQQPRSFAVRTGRGPEVSLECPSSFADRAGTPAARGRGVLLVRRYDASSGGQEAGLRLNGRVIGSIFEASANKDRSLAEDALWADLRSSDCADGFLHLAALPAAGVNGAEAPWNESRYEALFMETDGSEDAPLPLKQGSNIRICDAGLPGGPFYINDHTIVRGPDGRWHLMGIFHHELADPLNEIDFVHARAASGDPASWSGQDFEIGKGTAGVALSVDRSLGETHLWAPHAVRNGDEYVMVFHSGGPDDDSQIKIARSRDLENWTRVPAKPIFSDICVARDPMLLRQGDLWVLYYTRCDGLKTRVNGVAYRTSSDLVNWSAAQMALTLPKLPPLPNSGYTESPFVFERDGWYYLSVTSYPVEYDASFLYRSRSPFNFGDVPVARFKTHAPEWVEGGDEPGHGPLFITHAGWGQGGVWMSPVTGW